MSTVLVTSSAGLLSALQSAQSGDTITLAPGVYSDLTIQNFQAAGSVTITSADPNRPASLVNLNVFNSSGLTFTHVEVTQTPGLLPDPFPNRITGSTRITFDHVSFHGTLDGDPTTDRAGLLLTDSTFVSIANSEFQQLSYAVVHGGADYLLFSNNLVHDIRFAGVHGTSSYVTITSNYFTDFYPIAGDHPDAIHFFNQTSTDAPHDIVVSDNVIVRGSGSAIQGIFFELPTASVVTPHNLTITDNLLIGTLYNAITILGNATAPYTNVNVSDNSISSIGEMTARVWLGNTVNAVLSGNEAGAYIYGSKTDTSFNASYTNSNILVIGNATSAPVTDGGAALQSEWLGKEDFITTQPSEPTTAIAETDGPARLAEVTPTLPALPEVGGSTEGVGGGADAGVTAIEPISSAPAADPPSSAPAVSDAPPIVEPVAPYLGSFALFNDGELVQLLGLGRAGMDVFFG